MRLISERSGIEIKIGDRVTTFRGESGTLSSVRLPHKPGSSGHVGVKFDAGGEQEFFPAVIGARFVP
jgi:hypothetical protein